MNLCELESIDSKRKHLNDNDEPSMLALKIHRPNSPSPPPLQPLKITDFDFNCLENIFAHSDLPSLFSVAAANAYLRRTAQYIYARKFGREMVCLTPGKCWTSVSSEVSANDGIAIVYGMKTSLEYLRSLGESIAHLWIMYRDTDGKQSECIDMHLKQYCAESLNTLALIEKKSDDPWKFIEKPFVAVRNLVIQNSKLTDQLALLSAGFPNLQLLWLRDVQMYDRSVELPFQYLQHLFIDVNNGTRCNGFAKREAADLMRLCPALCVLDIRMPIRRQGMTFKTLTNVIQNNPALRCLQVTMESYRSFVKLEEVNRFVREHPEMHSISLENFVFTPEMALIMLRQLNGLMLFKFQVNDSQELHAFHGLLNAQWNFKWALPIHSSHGCIVEVSRQ